MVHRHWRKADNNIVRSLIASKMWISLAAVFFYRSGFYLLEIKPPSEPVILDIVIFFSTYLIYNLPKVSPAVRKINENRLFVFSILFSGIILFSSIFILDWKTLLYLSHLGILSFYYNYPVNRNKFILIPFRAFPYIKILLISYIWASLGSIMPLFLINSIPGIEKTTAVFIIQFLFIFSITIPFDIRDYYSDKIQEILTIPGSIGIRRSRELSFLTILLFIISGGLTLNSWIPFIITGMILFLLIYFSRGKGRYYYTGIIDGSIILYWLILRLYYVNLDII